MAIQLVTFGGLRATNESGELNRLLAQHSRAALFVYLAVERRAARESLLAMFWPESDGENARHALRQSLYHIRKAVGAEWIETRAHELAVTEDVCADAHSFTRALEHGDVERAVALYDGPFLDGVHLADLPSWESWVDAKRSLYARAFRKACRDVLDEKRASGDVTGFIRIAERWAARDPTDDEAQHRLIEALAGAGERAEALRQYETYARMLESDGLTPLDETRALADRLRSETASLPPLAAITTRVPPDVPASSPPAAPRDVPATSSASERRATPTRLTIAAAVLLVVLTFALAFRATRARTPVASPAAVAVLPFTVRGDTTARYLGDGMVSLLGAALDGAGTLRPVDARATFAAVGRADGTPMDVSRADRLAARAGAGRYVLGEVVGAGGMLRIDAAIYDVGTSTGSSKAEVSGSADSVFVLVDRLAARLLGGLGDPASDRLTRIASITTDSLTAFKHYLDGEENMRAGQFERAADDYLAAIALDSTFAVASYRLALAREWAPLPGEDDAARAAARHGARLSARDRMLLEAFRLWRAGDAEKAEHAYRAIVARHPDDVDAWTQLGEIGFHYDPLIGRTLGESENEWRRVLAYEPRNLFALLHLARIAAADDRRALLDSLLAPFDPEERRTDRRLVEVSILSAVAKRDTVAAHALAHNVGNQESLPAWRIAAFLTAFAHDPAAMRPVIQEMSTGLPSSGLRADLYWFTSVLELAAGRASASALARAHAGDEERAVGAEQRRPAFEEVTEWYAATLPLPYDDSTLILARRHAASPVRAVGSGLAFVNELGIGAPIQLEPVRQYALGILSLRLRDTPSANTAAASLERLAASSGATALTRDLDRGLRARLAFANGRSEEALRLLEALDAHDAQGDIAVTPFVSRASERYLHAEVLTSLGRDEEALRWLASLGSGSVTEIPLRAPSELRQAEIYDRHGDRVQAIRHYESGLELWRYADLPYRTASGTAQQRLAALRKVP